MAKQISIIQFTGRLGNTIGYHRKEGHFLRSTPDTIRQTAATRRASQRFGMASKKGAFIRHTIYAALDVNCDSTHINRLTKALIPSAGNNIRSLKGFRFNQSAGTDHFFPVAPSFSADNILHIPAQTLPQYKGITALEVKVIATRIDCITRRVITIQTAACIIDTTVPFDGIMLPADISGTGTLMISLQIRGMQGNSMSGNKQHLVADIVAIQPPQAQTITPAPSCKKTAIVPHEEEVQLQISSYQLVPAFIQRE